MRKLSLELLLAVGGIVLTILLVVLDKAEKLKGGILFWLLMLAAALTVPLALGNSVVADTPAPWRLWLRGIALAVVGFSYWALAIWIRLPNESAENKTRAPQPPQTTSSPSPVKDSSKEPHGSATKAMPPQQPKPSMIEEKALLVPSGKPEPQLRIDPIPQDATDRLKGSGINPEDLSLQGQAFLKSALGRIPTNALKVYLGNSSLGYTTKHEQVVFSIAGRDVLTIHKATDGSISVDAEIFGKDNRIIAGISKNAFHLNKGHSDYWRLERPSASTLIVYDQFGDKALFIDYLRPNVVKILGKFQYSGVIILVSEDELTLNGRPWFVGGISGDNGGALFSAK
jgi:hypothetical protein